jgi:hypothetical protein
MATAAACGTLIGLSMYEAKGHLFQGNFQKPYTLLSSAVDYSSVPIAGLLSSLAISKFFVFHSAHTHGNTGDGLES